MPRLNYSGFLSPKTKGQKGQNTSHQHTNARNGETGCQNHNQTIHTDPGDQDTKTEKELTVASLIQNHPWAALGLGFILGGLAGRTIKRSHRAFKLNQHQ